MPTFDCPSCGQPLLVTRAHAGRAMRCPGCASNVTVPAAAATPPPRGADADDERAAADAIARAVGDRMRGVPAPRPPALPAARNVVVVAAVVAGVALLLLILFLAVVL